MGELCEDERTDSVASARPPATRSAETSAMLLLDAAGEVRYASPGVGAALGTFAPDLVGQSIVRFVVDADRTRVRAWLGDRSAVDEVMFGIRRRPETPCTAVASRLPVADGDVIVMRLIEADGPPVAASALEQLRVETDGLAGRDDVSDLLFAAAHDTRAPLMSISAAAQGLVRLAGADLDEPAQALLGQLLYGIGQMSATINASLRCSQAGVGLRFEEVDCDELLASVQFRLSTVLAQAGATVDADALGWVRADRAQLGSVFANVIENAASYRVHARPLHISVKAREGPNERTFVIADNGRGVAPADRERVFGMFERLDRSATGTGIGLAICDRIIHAHGGRIWLTGNEHGGTTMRFTLPHQPRMT